MAKSYTFDINIRDEMEGLIKSHRPKDKSEKSTQKREQEAEILKLFRIEGEELRRAYQAPVAARSGAREQSKQPLKTEARQEETSIYPDLKI
ncbi:hypothetical protein chiPu_0001745 [Chiloscyllium punctatum]|uniref:Uncharacterized protein n=1 Tax=Chiloscyllium punctatum TaxID=137246 RepID=A0A401RYX1_CHIPU|nr:hypothetical protein [Chiloscyllium punctatum]